MTQRRVARSNRRGFALLAALWLMVTLSVLALAIATPARTRRLAAANASEIAYARAAADAGFEHARARLDARLAVNSSAATAGAQDDRDPWRSSAVLFPDTVTLGVARYHVTMNDAGARLNLNVAGTDVLLRFFSALQIDAGVADRLAQAIADWRDADDLVRARGAERKTYLERGMPVMPRNAPFARVDEVRDVLGMTPEIFEAIRPFLTVAGSGRVNVNAAGAPVLSALPGFTDEVVAAVLRLRAGGIAIISLDQLALSLSSGARRALLAATADLAPIVTYETTEVEITSDGWLVKGSAARSRVSGSVVRSGGVVFVVGQRAE